MTDDFDPTPYVRPPVLDVPSAVALGVALLTALPKDAPAHVKKAAKSVRSATSALQQAWARADATGAPPDRRKSDARVDNAWGILFDRLAAYAKLPAATNAKAARAGELVTLLGGDDRSWLKLPYAAEWAESRRRIQKLDAEGLAADVDALAGEAFVAEVRAAHEAYGAALGVTKQAVAAEAVDLATPLRAVTRAIAKYGIAVVGTASDDEPETITAVRRALAPIDAHREGHARRATSGAGPAPITSPTGTPPPAEPEPTPTTPLPDVPV